MHFARETDVMVINTFQILYRRACSSRCPCLLQFLRGPW